MKINKYLKLPLMLACVAVLGGCNNDSGEKMVEETRVVFTVDANSSILGGISLPSDLQAALNGFKITFIISANGTKSYTITNPNDAPMPATDAGTWSLEGHLLTFFSADGLSFQSQVSEDPMTVSSGSTIFISWVDIDLRTHFPGRVSQSFGDYKYVLIAEQTNLSLTK